MPVVRRENADCMRTSGWMSVCFILFGTSLFAGGNEYIVLVGGVLDFFATSFVIYWWCFYESEVEVPRQVPSQHATVTVNGYQAGHHFPAQTTVPVPAPRPQAPQPIFYPTSPATVHDPPPVYQTKY